MQLNQTLGWGTGSSITRKDPFLIGRFFTSVNFKRFTSFAVFWTPTILMKTTGLGSNVRYCQDLSWNNYKYNYMVKTIQISKQLKYLEHNWSVHWKAIEASKKVHTQSWWHTLGIKIITIQVWHTISKTSSSALNIGGSQTHKDSRKSQAENHKHG